MPRWLPVLLALCASPAVAGDKKKPPPVEDVAATLIGEAMVSDRAWERLTELSDDIGHRLSGSPQLDAAIAWAAAAMEADGLANVRTEPVMIPRWVRGDERLVLLGDRDEPLPVLALGNSVGTPEGGIEADVVVLGSREELEATDVSGKIVLFDVPFTTYGETVQFRTRGPAEAGAKGALAVLVRSVGPTGHRTPHTGATYYGEDESAPRIPGAAIAAEDAARMRRLAERGRPVRVRLELGAHFDGEVESANVIGEVPGRTDAVVVLACHLDSWDVGQGTQDDGAGCVTVMEAGRLIAGLGVAPLRTVRVVLYTNEENGLRGGSAYAEAHAGEVHFAALESDTGAGQPDGFRVDVRSSEEPQPDEARSAALIEVLRPGSALLTSVEADGLRVGWGGADISPLANAGVPTLGVDHDTTDYWPIHHTAADTLDRVDPRMLERNVATVAVMGWWLAQEAPDPLMLLE